MSDNIFLMSVHREDWEFLVRNEALNEQRMRAVETGGCPHAAIREVSGDRCISTCTLAQVIMQDMEITY